MCEYSDEFVPATATATELSQALRREEYNLQVLEWGYHGDKHIDRLAPFAWEEILTFLGRAKHRLHRCVV